MSEWVSGWIDLIIIFDTSPKDKDKSGLWCGNLRMLDKLDRYGDVVEGLEMSEMKQRKDHSKILKNSKI